MANDIESRIVQMVFDNAKFEAGIAQTLTSLGKLDETLKKIGTTNGLAGLQKSIDQLNTAQLDAKLDALKGKLSFPQASQGFSQINTEANKVNFGGLTRALDTLRGKFGFGPAASQGFSQAQTASNRLNFSGISRSLDVVKSKIGGVGTEATSSFGDVSRAASATNISAISQAAEGAGRSFGVLQGIASVALGNIAAKAVSTGASLLKSLSLGPIIQGFQEYGTNLNSIQTILANTQSEGAGLQDVNASLNELNHYSDQTIYNFSEMAKNIGTFTAAGVKLKPATESIKGIANLAALSGSNSQQASTAMYQLSQAIAAGRVSLQDWNSVVNAGMGGKVFQKALFDTAKQMGTLTGVPVGQTFEQWEKAGNSFRQSLSQTQKKATTDTNSLANVQKEAAKSVQKAEEDAADAIENAHERVADAQKGVSDAAKQGAEDVANATKEQQQTVKQGAEDVKNALQDVVDARKRLAEAMKPPSKDELGAAADKLKTAQLDQKDLSDAVAKAQQEQTRAAQDLTTAQGNLADLQRKGATPAEIQSAQRAVEDAQTRVTDSSDAQTRALINQRDATRGVHQAAEDLAETKKKGTKDDKNVQDAQDALTLAIKNYRDAQVKARDDVSAAQKRVADAVENSADRQKDAAKQLSDAEEQEAKTVKDSQESIAEAHENAAQRIAQAKQKTGAPDEAQLPGWLTSKVLTNTLAQFTGDLSDAQLKAKGFSDEQIKAIQQTAKTAKNAATEVKTLSGVFDVTKEAIGSGWAQTFQLIFGDFGQAKTLFTSMSNAIQGFVGRNAKARNQVLQDWQKMGGRTKLLDGLKVALDGLKTILNPIKQGFRDIFPEKTGKDLYNLTVAFHKFAETIKIGPTTAKNLRSSFAGFFAILDIGKQLLLGAVSGVKTLFNAMGDGKGNILNVTGGLGNFLVALDKSIKKGDVFKKFFDGLGRLAAKPLKAIRDIAKAIVNLFSGASGIDTSSSDAAFKSLSDKLHSLDGLTDGVKKAFDKITKAIGRAVDKIKEALPGIGQAIVDSFPKGSLDSLLKIVNTILLGGLVVILRNFSKNFGGAIKGPSDALKRLIGEIGGGLDSEGGSVIGNIRKSFGAVTDSLTTMQTNLQAGTLQKIAIAIGVLTASIVALSLIDTAKLGKAMSTIGVAFAELLVAMGILSKISASTGFVQLPLLSASMIGLSVAIDLLTIAIAKLGKLDVGTLAKGLGAVAAALGIMIVAAIPLTVVGPGLGRTAVSLIALGLALRIIASAVAAFGKIGLGDLAKGLGAMAASLSIIAAATLLFPQNLGFIGTQLLLIATALRVMANAVQEFGKMDIGTIAKGILGIGAAMVVLGKAMLTFPPGLLAQGVGLVAVATGLRIMAGAIARFGNMSVGQIAKGIIALGGSLFVLSKGLAAMSGSGKGAASLLAAAIAIRILAPGLVLLGKMDIGAVVTALAALGGALAAFGVTAAALSPVVPAVLALAAGVTALGLATLAAGAGIGLFSTGLAALAVAGPAGLAILGAAIGKVISSIVEFAKQIALGIVAGVKVLVDHVPAFVAAAGAIITGMYVAIKTNLPKIVATFGELVSGAITAIHQNAPRIIAEGFNLLMQFLHGVMNNIGQVTTTVANIITKFLSAVASKIGGIISSGANLLVNFVKGITDNIPKIVTAVAKMITTFLTSVANKLPDVIAAGTRIVTKFIGGIGNAASDIIAAGVKMISKIISGIASAIPRLVDTAFKAATDFLHKMASTIRNNDDQIIDAAFDLGDAIVVAILKGVASLPKRLLDKVVDGVTHPLDVAKAIVGGGGAKAKPGYTGKNSTSGIDFGGILKDSTEAASKATNRSVNGKASVAIKTVDTFQASLQSLASTIGTVSDTSPVITPVLDLSKVQAQTKSINGNVIPISAASSYDGATAVAAERARIDLAKAQLALAAQQPSSFTFKQTNTSPKALSESEIYRNTKNGLSLAKRLIDQRQTKLAG